MFPLETATAGFVSTPRDTPVLEDYRAEDASLLSCMEEVLQPDSPCLQNNKYVLSVCEYHNFSWSDTICDSLLEILLLN